MNVYVLEYPDEGDYSLRVCVGNRIVLYGDPANSASLNVDDRANAAEIAAASAALLNYKLS